MKEDYLINENKKPLLDIENDLDEMSKNLKIISSFKRDIEELIDKQSNIKQINKINILSIKEKYNQIKIQIKKFMNKKNYIYNFIRIEKTSKNINNKNDENINLLEENKMENVMENIKKMKNDIKNKNNILENKLKKIEILEIKDSLIDEININEINNENDELKNFNQFQNSILNTKADIYNEETKELEKVTKTIEMIKKGTNDMKIFVENQDNIISNLNNKHKNIEDDIENGINELSEAKKRRKYNNKNILTGICCLIIIIIIFIYFIYNKINSRK